MTQRICTITVVLLSVLCARLGATENGTTELTTGTRFLVGFIHPDRAPGEPLPDSAYRVLIHAVKGARVTVDGRQVTVQPGTTTEVKLPVRTVVDVQSDRPVSVWSRQAMNGNGEQSHHLPVSAWGRDYRAFAWWTDRHGLDSASMLYSSAARLIIAAYDNTRVTVETHNGTIDTTLNAGQWWMVGERIDTASIRSTASDPTGLLISATRPIGVISGHTKAAILAYPDGLPMTGPYARPANRCRGNLHDAMFPTSMAGTEFVTVPMSYTPTRERGLDLRDQGIGDDRGDVIRFIALGDSTIIHRLDSSGTSVQVALLKKGASWMETRSEDATLWRTSKPALCAQYGKSYGHITSQTTRPEDDPSTDAGMPLLMTVPDTDRWVTTAHLSAYAETYNAVTLVARNEDISTIRLNNIPIVSLGKKTSITGSPYSFIRVTLPQGAYTLRSDSSKPFVCWSYGSLDGYQLGRIYGGLAAVDTRRQCDDSIDVSVIYSGDSAAARGSIINKGGVCSELAMLYLESAANLVSTLNDDGLTIRRIDPRMPGSARVIAVSTSGRTAAHNVEFSVTTVSASRDNHPIGVHYSPTSGILSIHGLHITTPSKLSVYTMGGQVIHESLFQGDSTEIHLGQVAAGLHLVIVDKCAVPLIIL